MVKMPKGGFRAVPSRTARFLYCICSILSRIFLFFLSKSRRTRCGSLCCKKCRKTLRQRRFAQFLLFFTKRKSASRNKTFLSVLPIFPSGLPASFTISLQKLNWFADLVKSGDFRLVGEDVFFSGPFGSQAVASYIGSSAGVSYVELAVNDAFEIGCVPIPQEGPVRYISSWGNNFACLSTDEDHARGAYMFLKFLTSTENIVQWAEAFGTVPIYKEARESAEFQQFAETNIAVKALTEEADDIGMLASVPGAAAMRTEIDKMVQSVALNVSDADTAYAAFETACREALAK